MSKNQNPLCKTGVWSRAVPIKAAGNHIIIPDPFPGEKPFKPPFCKNEELSMTKLLNFEYYRQWKDELDKFMSKRYDAYAPIKHTFPIYRKIVKKPAQDQKEKPKLPNKKYANVKAKVFDSLKTVKK